MHPETEIQLADGRWVLAITYPQYDATVAYPKRLRSQRGWFRRQLVRVLNAVKGTRFKNDR